MKQKNRDDTLTEVLAAWEREQEKLTSDEIEAKMKRHKNEKITAGSGRDARYWADQKWRVWTELLRDKKLQSLLED